MKLIVGLGNPGNEYAATRHNVGWMAMDRLADRLMLSGGQSRFHATVVDTMIAEEKVMLLKPMTFMNRSGLAVGEAARFFRLEADDVLVVYDDTALPFGRMRLRKSGGPGGHNGIKDIQRALGTSGFPRLRLGVGEPRIGEHRIPQADYVLSAFNEDEKSELPKILDAAAQACETWVREGIDSAMNRFNEFGKPAEPAPEPREQSAKNKPPQHGHVSDANSPNRSESDPDSHTTERRSY